MNWAKSLSGLHRRVGWLRHIYTHGSAADVIAATADTRQVAGFLTKDGEDTTTLFLGNASAEGQVCGAYLQLAHGCEMRSAWMQTPPSSLGLLNPARITFPDEKMGAVPTGVRGAGPPWFAPCGRDR